MAQHIRQLLLTIVLVGNVPITLNDIESLVELLNTVVALHVLLELREFTRWNINHVHFWFAKLLSCINWLLSTWFSWSFIFISIFVIGLSAIIAHCWALLRIWSFRHLVAIIAVVVIWLIILIQSVDVVHVHLVELGWILTCLGLVICILNLQFHHFFL